MTSTSDFELLFDTMGQMKKLIFQSACASIEDRTATMLQFSALQFLKEHPKSTVSDLADHLKLSKSSTTQLVERLVVAGFVERMNDRKDRRIIRLHIIGSGGSEFVTLRAKFKERMQQIFANIPEKDIKELIRIHTNLIQTLGERQHE